MISPIYISDEILKLLPKTRISVGEKDCVKDDSIRLFYKLKKLNVDVKIKLYYGMKHGFLNLDMPMGLKESH